MGRRSLRDDYRSPSVRALQECAAGDNRSCKREAGAAEQRDRILGCTPQSGHAVPCQGARRAARERRCSPPRDPAPVTVEGERGGHCRGDSAGDRFAGGRRIRLRTARQARDRYCVGATQPGAAAQRSYYCRAVQQRDGRAAADPPWLHGGGLDSAGTRQNRDASCRRRADRRNHIGGREPHSVAVERP